MIPEIMGGALAYLAVATCRNCCYNVLHFMIAVITGLKLTQDNMMGHPLGRVTRRARNITELTLGPSSC
jgi:hypothetical protein